MLEKNVSTIVKCVGSNNVLVVGIVIGLLIIVIPTHMYFRWTPWAPPLLQRLLTNSTFQVSYILVSIILSCLTNQGVALTMYILHIALFSKFASMNIPENEEGFTDGLWNH